MKFNSWYLSSLIISFIVLIPIITVFTSFFENTSNYYEILKNTFLFEYILNSLILLIGVLILTLLIGVMSAYLVSFYNFTGVNFFKWALILSFAVPPYIYAYSLTAFFENYGTAFLILKSLFGEGNYNSSIPKFDGMLGAILSLSFSLFIYVYILARASFYYQSQNLIELGKNLGFSNGRYLNYVGFREDGSLPGAGVISDAGWRSQVAEEEPPLAKLFVSILQRLGVGTDSFAGYSGTLERV